MTDQLVSFDAERFAARVGSFGHSAQLGIRYAGHGADWTELAMDPAPHFLAADGMLAFGPLATLCDMACGLSLWVAAGRFYPHVTLDLRIDRLREPHRGRTITAHGRCLRMVGEIGHVRGHAHDGDPADPIALVAGTFIATGR